MQIFTTTMWEKNQKPGYPENLPKYMTTTVLIGKMVAELKQFYLSVKCQLDPGVDGAQLAQPDTHKT